MHCIKVTKDNSEADILQKNSLKWKSCYLKDSKKNKVMQGIELPHYGKNDLLNNVPWHNVGPSKTILASLQHNPVIDTAVYFNLVLVCLFIPVL